MRNINHSAAGGDRYIIFDNNAATAGKVKILLNSYIVTDLKTGSWFARSRVYFKSRSIANEDILTQFNEPRIRDLEWIPQDRI